MYRKMEPIRASKTQARAILEEHYHDHDPVETRQQYVVFPKTLN